MTGNLTKPMTAPNRNIRTLLLTMFLNQTCLSLTFPLLTLIIFDPQSRLFDANMTDANRSFWYGLCLSLPTLIAIFFSPLFSALSDVYGRKRILFIEVSAAVLFTLIAGLGVLYGIFGLIFIGILIQGSLTRANPTAQAIMADICPENNKVLYMGYLQFMIAIGACLGPLLGGLLADQFFFAQLNFSFAYFIAAIFSTLAAVIFYSRMQETLTTSSSIQDQFSLRVFTQLMQNPNIQRISIILLLTQISWSTYYQFMPPILKTIYQFNSQQIGLFVGMIALWLAVATGIGIKLLQKFFDTRALLLLSIYLMLAGLIISYLGVTQDSWLAWFGAIPTAAGDVIAFTCLTALYSDAVSKHAHGKVMAICFIIVSLIWAVTSFVGGILLAYSPLLPLIAAPVGVIAALGYLHTRSLTLTTQLNTT